MEKQSILFVAIGTVVLAVAVFIGFKSKPSAKNEVTIEQKAPAPIEKPVEINVSYGKSEPLEPRLTKIEQGQKVIIKVASDTAGEVHFHGYDLTVRLEPGKVGEISFIADKTGRFEYELENLSKTLGFIEVYPK